MIIAYDKLRKSIEPPEYEKISERESIRRDWIDRIEYAKTMALINIAQELNEIKHRMV